MKAMVIERYGEAEEFTLADMPVPAVEPGRVLVRVEATSVNPVDLLTRSMGAPLAPGLPAVLHGDVAGVVERVGEGVRGFAVGDAVYGCVGGVAGNPGALADFVLADAGLLAQAPKRLSARVAAALPLVAITAWEAVFERADVQPGQTVLVYGGTGGVGHLVVQLAKHAGAVVTATVGDPARADIVRGFGADSVVSYRDVPVEEMVRDLTGGGGFDVVIDTVGGGNLPNAFAAAKLHGQVVTTVALGPVDMTVAHMRGLGVHVVFMLIPLLHGVGRSRHGGILGQVAGLVDAGVLRPLIDGSDFTFDQVADAHRRMEEGRHLGKIVLRRS